MKQRLLMFVMGCLMMLSAWSQETVAVNTGNIVSPELNETERTVTFRMFAPKAEEVTVEADFFGRTKMQTPGRGGFLRTDEDADSVGNGGSA